MLWEKYMSPELTQKDTDDLRLKEYNNNNNNNNNSNNGNIIMEFQKIISLLDDTTNNHLNLEQLREL